MLGLSESSNGVREVSNEITVWFNPSSRQVGLPSVLGALPSRIGWPANRQIPTVELWGLRGRFDFRLEVGGGLCGLPGSYRWRQRTSLRHGGLGADDFDSSVERIACASGQYGEPMGGGSSREELVRALIVERRSTPTLVFQHLSSVRTRGRRQGTNRRPYPRTVRR